MRVQDALRGSRNGVVMAAGDRRGTTRAARERRQPRYKPGNERENDPLDGRVACPREPAAYNVIARDDSVGGTQAVINARQRQRMRRTQQARRGEIS